MECRHLRAGTGNPCPKMLGGLALKPHLPDSEGDKMRKNVRQRLVRIDFGWTGGGVNVSAAGGRGAWTVHFYCSTSHKYGLAVFVKNEDEDGAEELLKNKRQMRNEADLR